MPEPTDTETLAEVLAGALAEHRLTPSTRDCFPPEPWKCGCGEEFPSAWTAEGEHRTHVAAALAARTEQARAGEKELVDLVAQQRDELIEVYEELDHFRQAAPALPFTLRVPTNRVDNADGQALNTGTAYVDVQVILEPDLAVRGECRPGYSGSVIALREWNEQVFLHELLHVATDYIQPSIRTEADPHGHNILSRIEVALWESGWRFRRDGEGALRERVEEWLGRYDLGSAECRPSVLELRAALTDTAGDL